MHVLAIYQVNQHLAELMAEAEAHRLARRKQARTSPVRRLVASLAAIRRSAAPAASAI